MISSFVNGYNVGIRNTGAILGAELGESYINDVQSSVDELARTINSFKGINTDISQLKGDILEFWHAGTFNIDAVVNSTGEIVYVPRSNDFASPDIITSWMEYYGLKNYRNSSESAKQQAMSFFEYYMQKKKNDVSFEDWCQKLGFNNPEDLLNTAIYKGQTRIIPTDQLEGAKEWLNRKILEESYKRTNLVSKYQDTLDNLMDRIQSPKGAESRPISEMTTRQIATHAKQGDFDPNKYNVGVEDYIKFEHILKQALTAGTSAAVLTAVLKIAPNIVKLIELSINREYISNDDLRNIGIECLSASSQAFIKGTIAASLTTTFKAGLAGEILKRIDPILIGISTTIAFNAISNAIRMAKDQITVNAFADFCMRDVFIAVFAYGGSLGFQSFIPIPIIGAIFGNIIGGIVGTFVYSVCDNLYLSFCIETGYTFLGIVRQDYSLPTEVLKDLGLDIVLFDTVDLDCCEADICEPDICMPDVIMPDTCTKYLIRRGVVGINRIGYTIG